MDVPVHEIVAALENDAQLDFKQTTGKTFRQGRCPSCGKRELYISKENPYQLKCPRDNNCGYEESTRSRYPHLWEDLSKRVPATEADPHATAKAFLVNRGFDVARMQGMFTQEIRRIQGTEKQWLNIDVVRFPLWEGHYWDRIINEKDVRLVGDKARTSPGLKYVGKCWKPVLLTINPMDTVFITEGIFHALAFMFSNEKAVASISSSNFPWELIEEHKGKNITWVIAFDDDEAGHKFALKYLRKMREMKEKVRVALTGSSDDWDDIYKTGKLDKDFIDECLWRGDVFGAANVSEKAWHIYRKKMRAKNVMDLGKKLYSITVNSDQLYKELNEPGDAPQVELATEYGFDIFTKNMTAFPISNCLPVFKYCETDKLTNESAYYFQIQNNHGDKQVKMAGGALESPASFNKALLMYAPGCTFDGEAWQFRILRDKWFNDGIDYVSTVPFIGYEKQSGIYIFPEFAFYQGRVLKMNKFGYVVQGQHKLKTTFRNIDIVHSEIFTADWLDDYLKTFHWNGLVALAYWLGSLFAEQVRARQASYPFLEMSGEPGTGKSTVLEFLWKCVGRDGYEGFDPSKATLPARARAFIQVANLPVVLIEGDRNKNDFAKKGAFDYNELKSAYNGRAIRSTGAFTRGSETIEPPFRGSIVIAQNAEVDSDKAVLERIVHVNFTKAHFTPDSKRLSDAFHKKHVEDCAGFLPTVLQNENTILHTFDREFARIEQTYTANGKLKNTRIIKNHAQIAAFGHALAVLFPAMRKKDSDGKTRSERLELFLEERGMAREKRLIDDHPLIEQFWQTYELLEHGMEKDSSSTQLNHSATQGQIAINLAHMWQVAALHKFNLPIQGDIKSLLTTSVKYKLVESNKVIKSALWQGKSVRCWVFAEAKDEK